MSTLAHERPAACPNCGASLAGAPRPSFCPQCGQETTLHAPTLAEFAHELAGHFVAVEGTLWRTLRLLATAPGRLTTEYFAGRRRRYVAPLRLYLSASFIFFLAVKIALAAGTMSFYLGPVDRLGRPITAARDPVAYQETIKSLQRCADAPASCGWYGRASARLGLKTAALSGHADTVGEHLIGMAPYAFFLLLPLFAATVMLAYRRRHLAYGAHFVFALHTYSLALLLLAVAVLLPVSGSAWAGPLLLGYGYWSLRTVYGGRWWATALRFALVVLLYGAALLVALAALSAGSVMLS